MADAVACPICTMSDPLLSEDGFECGTCGHEWLAEFSDGVGDVHDANGNLLANGDDVTVIKDGYFGDTSKMYFVGEPPILAKRLTDTAQRAMYAGMKLVKPGTQLGDIGAAIQAVVEAERFSVVREYCGHGIGQVFHEEPQILHYGKAGTGLTLKEGMVFTIEPMVNLGRPETKVLKDDWTAVTRDKSLSAQFEHSIGITAGGAEIFTLSPAGKFHPTY